MTQKTLGIDDRLHAYMLDHGIREPELLKKLRLETSKDAMARMQVSPEQGQFMSMLVSITQPKRILEIGTFTGYSSLAMAFASSDDVNIITCDKDETWTSIAKKYWQESEQDHKITLRLGEAFESLSDLKEEYGEESFDFIFLDADKENYPNYYPLLKCLLSKGGLLLIDNVFWGGKVIDKEDQSEPTMGVREMNNMLHQDKEMSISMIPISDGLTIVRKLI